MPAKDIYHDTVKRALLKQGWTITQEHLMVRSGGVNLYIDLGAEKIIAAEKNGEKIAVEIKSFIGKSNTYDFHQAVGEFIHYRLALKEEEPERILYLAVPSDVYKDFFMQPFVQKSVETNQLKLIVYDPKTEELTKWLN